MVQVARLQMRDVTPIKGNACSPEDSDAAKKEYELVSPSQQSSRDDEDSSDDGASSSRSSETQVIYTQDKVSVWPSIKRRISGRVTLVKQISSDQEDNKKSTVFFTWLPYLQGESSGEIPGLDSPGIADVPSTPVSEGQYAVHPIPLSDINSIQKQTPTLGNHCIVIVLRNGLTLPTFYFQAGGVRKMFSAVKEYAELSRSAQDHSTFLINDISTQLQRSIATIDLPDVLMIDPAQLAQLSHNKGGQVAEVDSLFGRVLGGYQRATQFAMDTTASMLGPRPAVLDSPGGGDSAAVQREETNVGLFELLNRRESETMSSSADNICPPPLTQDEWFTYLDSAGRIVDVKTLRTRIFYAGVEQSIRKESWKFLLGLYPVGSTAAFRQSILSKRCQEYERLKAQWTSITDKQAARFGKWRERKMRVEKDVSRTDSSHAFFRGPNNSNVETLRSILLTYSMYNFDLGYCQGMSDLASPILYVMRDEATAFWCFANLMEKMESNFSTDCKGMHTQLEALKALVKVSDPELHAFFEKQDCLNYFFCYRWLLVHFKREFAFEEALQVWEALWSCPYTTHFHIYICAAVLKMHKKAFISANMTFDELLSFCILLSGKIDLGRTMRVAEKIYKSSGQAGKECLQILETGT